MTREMGLIEGHSCTKNRGELMCLTIRYPSNVSAGEETSARNHRVVTTGEQTHGVFLSLRVRGSPRGKAHHCERHWPCPKPHPTQ